MFYPDDSQVAEEDTGAVPTIESEAARTGRQECRVGEITAATQGKGCNDTGTVERKVMNVNGRKCDFACKCLRLCSLVSI